MNTTLENNALLYHSVTGDNSFGLKIIKIFKDVENDIHATDSWVTD